MNDELSYSITISKYYFRVSKRSASPHSLTRRDCFVTQSSTEGTHALDRVSRPLKAPRATHSIVSIRRAAPRRHPCWTTNAAHTQPTNARKARRSFSLWVGGRWGGGSVAVFWICGSPSCLLLLLNCTLHVLSSSRQLP